MKIIDFIKEKLKKLFNRNQILLDNKDSLSEDNRYEDIVNEEEKKIFFELYKKVKNGKVKLEQLTINDMLKIQMMMQEENYILEEKTKKEEKNIKRLDKKIETLKVETKTNKNRIDNI